MLNDVKQALRVKTNAMDTEISDLIEAAKLDLSYSGINVDKKITVDETEVMDPLIKRAIITYCKANFGYDNPEAERFMESFRMLEIHMALSEDYKRVVE